MSPSLEKYQYLKRAQKRFLAGTNCKTPEIAVALGMRSIKQWADAVAEKLEQQLWKTKFGVTSRWRDHHEDNPVL